MSTNLLYHGFGIRGYTYKNTMYKGGSVSFRIEQERDTLRCVCCGSKDVKPKGKVTRKFKSAPIGCKAVFIVLMVQRVLCLACGALRQVKVHFADERRRYTKGFERYALELSRHMTIKDVAAHLGVSWDVIKDIQKRNLNRRFARPKLRKLKRLSLQF